VCSILVGPPGLLSITECLLWCTGTPRFANMFSDVRTMQFREVLKSVSELQTGDLELNRYRLSNHLWTRILGETTAASGRSHIFPTRERKDRSRCPDERVGRRSRHSRVAFPTQPSRRADPGDGSTSGMWSARATTAAALGKNRLFLPSDAGQADVAPSLFG
jgi:hypothetical protein